MPQLTLEMSIEELKNLIFQLPPQQLLILVEAIEERAETMSMMGLAESGFAEWNEAAPEDDPILALAGTLSFAPLSNGEIDQELYGPVIIDDGKQEPEG